jgi:SAM-dependent methyltransferase
MALATRYCQGKGIELGGASHNPFNLADCLNVAPCDGIDFLHPQDLDDYQQYSSAQERQAGDILPVDLIGDFQNIHAQDNTFDYLITSHVIEHVPNLFAAYIESARVLKNDGVFFCIFPKRTAAPTDRHRALKTLPQMIEDFDRGVDMTNVEPDDWRGHYQVFSLQSMIRAINHLNREGLCRWLIECVEETDSKVGNGHTVVLRKCNTISSLIHSDVVDFNKAFNELLLAQRIEKALLLVKAALSFEFFDSKKLYLAYALSRQLGSHHEAVEFLRQALIVDPENESLRKEFIEVTGVPYVNPTL